MRIYEKVLRRLDTSARTKSRAMIACSRFAVDSSICANRESTSAKTSFSLCAFFSRSLFRKKSSMSTPAPSATGSGLGLHAQRLAVAVPSGELYPIHPSPPHIRQSRFDTCLFSSYSGRGRTGGIGSAPRPAFDAGSDPARTDCIREGGPIQ